MYYPYFRGKQYELITIRENAELLQASGFVPIIEPVKESTNSLDRAIRAVGKAGGECILIVNPDCGDHCPDGRAIRTLLNGGLGGIPGLSVGILLTSSMSLKGISELCDQYSSRSMALIHFGFGEGHNLAAMLGEPRTDTPGKTKGDNITKHVFVDEYCGRLYRKNFVGKPRILVKDGFQHRKNREYPRQPEIFSDLYLTFEEESMDGFGDFLMVGDQYFESGGPAYAVAIHLTYIDDTNDGQMYIQHFISDRTETPSDPAGKFAEALGKLVLAVRQPGSPILRSTAVEEFVALHNTGRFPGLGYVKKLSMQHHIETLADHFRHRPQVK